MPLKSLIASLWAYRAFIVTAITNEQRARYARSRFGFAWAFVQPLAQVLIFSIVLSNVLAAKLPGISNVYGYAAYLLAGIACWSLFADILQRMLSMFIDNASMMKKISFPRSVLPLVAIGSALIGNLILILVLLVALPLLGFGFNKQLVWLLPLLATTVFFATGLGLLLGTINVFSRDIGHAANVFLQFWFWMTPVIYPVSIIPNALKPWLWMNPMALLVEGYQNVLVFSMPPPASIGYVLLVSVMLLLLGWWVFRRAAHEMVDVL
jgi:lipopolysaccharide transport system permease protein